MQNLHGSIPYLTRQNAEPDTLPGPRQSLSVEHILELRPLAGIAHKKLLHGQTLVHNQTIKHRITPQPSRLNEQPTNLKSSENHPFHYVFETEIKQNMIYFVQFPPTLENSGPCSAGTVTKHRFCLFSGLPEAGQPAPLPTWAPSGNDGNTAAVY